MEILIFWDERAPPGLQRPVARAISSILMVPVAVGENPVPVRGYVGRRRQADAQAILDNLASYRRHQHITPLVLLVVSQDLFQQGNDFLFGLARPSEGVAVLSTARLSNEYYDRTADDDDLVARIAREGAHELGHLMGLAHCDDTICIMYNPSTLDELDGKSMVFCRDCGQKIVRN
jgi:archaemetzincin